MYYYLYNDEAFEFAQKLDKSIYPISTDPNDRKDKYFEINKSFYNDFLKSLMKKETQHQEDKDQIDLMIFSSAKYLCDRSLEEIKSTDFSIIEGLYCVKKYSRGYRIKSTYFSDDDVDGKSPVVEREYSLVKKNGVPVSEIIDTYWYSINGTVALSKSQSAHFSAKDSAKIMKDIRETRILYLQNPESEFINETVKKYIDLLFVHYKDVVQDYILNGGKSFEDAINNESDQKIKSILNYKLQDGKTVKESILYQIHEED